jgi:hypothetical protein
VSERPLIVRVVTTADWMEAFHLVWEATVGRIAVGVAPPMEHLRWANRRGLCLSLARRCAENYGHQELARAWTILGADPRGPEWRTNDADKTYAPVFRALADAIVVDPALVDDAAFAGAVEGWHVLEHAGSDGEDDLIVVARRYGSMAKIDRDEVVAWARRWTSRDDDVRDHIAASHGTATSAASVGASARDSSRGHHEGRGSAAARLRDDAELLVVLGACVVPMRRLPEAEVARMADEFLEVWRN